MLNKVWELSAYTLQVRPCTLNTVWELIRIAELPQLAVPSSCPRVIVSQAAVTDTYADSNTRERRPYEADGLLLGNGLFGITHAVYSQGLSVCIYCCRIGGWQCASRPAWH